MRKGLFRICSGMLLMALLAFSSLSVAATDSAPDAQGETTEKVNVDTELVKLQKQLDGIKQQVSGAGTDAKLNVLNDTTLELVASADKLAGVLTPMRAQLQAQLDVLGPAPQPQAAVNETAEVTRKRASLNQQKQKLDAQASQVQAIKTGAENLSTQILALRRNVLKNQLALNSGSILGSRFWSPIIKPLQEDIERLSDLKDDLSEAFVAAWKPDWRYGSVFFLLLAAALGTVGRKLLEKYLALAGIRLLPEGRLRRSFLAIAVVFSTVLMMGMAILLVDYVFTRHGDVTDRAEGFIEGLVRLVVFCSMISGIGRAFLSNQRPSWRLPAIANPVARAMEPFSVIATSFIVIFGVIEQVNTVSGISVGVTVVGNGLSSLFLALTSGAIALRSDQIRRRIVEAGEAPETRSTLAGLIHLAVLLTTLAVLVSLLVGYISLARFLMYELVWVGIVLSLLYLATTFVEDVCESLFSPAFASGRQIKRTLNLDDRHLDQAATILSAGLKVLLLLMAVVALLNGTFGSTTPVELVQKIVEIWGGKGLESISIVPAHLVNAVILLIIGIYSLRVSRRWLEHDFFPKTTLEAGIKASLVTLYSNIGYILIILLTLATLGIEWNKLAWIVSALSVGIGFGLQEIVKNFISGLILLTERPVKVGDLVNISGVEGDIRRINVRATEIQLGDRSTVIVPNSQFISQNVRNITMGNPQGVATLVLTFPLDIDPEMVRRILLDAYDEHEKILENPAPSVMFSQLMPNGMVLSVTGYVSSPRMVASAKSDLLFDIIKRLRADNIPLAVPQKMVLESSVDISALQTEALPRQ
ncbi:DUF3772 domain-containing protein [Dickeya chrysanthemi]|uniref:DUF3772 domain-containing protein n=1 Tax=Dickeya chrysanthemi TaxID=556 RepID=UPI0005876117|nr:DUF3772 domain-containing protein [Dickeya chrysanthemi]MBX9445618.1 mechanosensitive ion channel family protein [Dickeya chrysanthemi]MCA7008513.1 DUF3772 domain-containing protein [Dickeya chrysanthemi]